MDDYDNLRGGGADPAPADERPYGIPREWQGAVYDVWSLIIDFITDPKEVMNLCDVSKLFRRMLRRKYVQVRLPVVLELCLKLDFCRASAIIGTDPDEVMTVHSTFMTRMLELRLVSKLVKKSTEDFLYERENLEIMGLQKEIGHIPDWNFIHVDYPTLTYSSTDRINEFLREMGQLNIQNNGTGFPPSLQIYENDDLENPEEDVARLLQRIGRSVKSFKYGSLSEHMVSYNRLLSWLRHTPNLETLKISPGPFTENDTVEPNIPQFLTLEKLKVFEDGYEFPVEFREKILEANPTIRIILQEGSPWPLECPRISPRTELLQSLQLEKYVSKSPPPLSFYSIQLQWPLRSLTLVDRFPDPDIDNDTVMSQALFSFLNQFRSLEKLHVEQKVRDNGGELQLPNLRNFSWRIQKTFESVNFMLPLKKLERFDCFLGQEVPDEMYEEFESPYVYTQEDIEKPKEGEVLQFFQGVQNNNFKNTNLKTFFPRLKEIWIITGVGLTGRMIFDI